MRRLAVLVACLTVAAGCSKSVTKPLPVVEVAPVADTPVNAVRRLAWCWNHRATDAYATIFTDDYQFHFALGDTAGNSLRIDRAAEMLIAHNIFVGGVSGGMPPATGIVMEMDPVLVVNPDSRPGLDPEYHKEISTNLNFELRTSDLTWRVTGQASVLCHAGRFRDDSAVPQGSGNHGRTQSLVRGSLGRRNVQWRDFKRSRHTRIQRNACENQHAG